MKNIRTRKYIPYKSKFYLNLQKSILNHWMKVITDYVADVHFDTRINLVHQ